MRHAQLGDDGFFFPDGRNRAFAYPAKVVKVGAYGQSFTLFVFTDTGSAIRKCHHIDDPWHDEYQDASQKQGSFDFTLEPAVDVNEQLVVTLLEEHGGDVDEVFKRVRSRGVSKKFVESMLAKA